MSQAPVSNVSGTGQLSPSFLRAMARHRTRTAPEERCELCSAPLGTEHQHLLDARTRQISCACDGCAVLFCGQEGAQFRRIPRRIRRVVGFEISDTQWESLMIPISLAFFYREAAADRVRAMYPSPAGAMESLLSLESWQEIVAENEVLQTAEPDVEAFLVNRISSPAEYFLVPIDECYRLTGMIRIHWRGLSGGAEVWKAIHGFFDQLRSRSVDIGEPSHA